MEHNLFHLENYLKMSRCFGDCCAFITNSLYLISWMSLVTFIFYNSYIYYMSGRQFYYLRQMLGIGLCISRGTAAVLNLCCALVLLPLCKKLNPLVYRLLSRLCPGLFFFWLERAKSFHMTVAITLVVFAVVHSISHFINIWNFSRNYDEIHTEINMAMYRNESPFLLLMTVPGVTGVSMLLIVLSMGATSTRFVRRRLYNTFWYTHQLYLPFLLLLMIHPLSGVLKEEVLKKYKHSGLHLHEDSFSPKFVAINSVTWAWMAVPLALFCLDLLWRIFSRNLAKVKIISVTHMAGRTLSVRMSCPEQFACRRGQYVLMQVSCISLIEWHPFTVVQLPTTDRRDFVVWIKVKGDWTEALEKCLLGRSVGELSVLIDGPFSSPMEGVSRCEVALCVAAGVGITPFVAVLLEVLRYPRNALPGRIHLIWIVRYEREITWLAEIAERVILHTRYANRPDRLHLEFYVTKTNNIDIKAQAVVNEKGVTHVLKGEERKSLLTPNWSRKEKDEGSNTFLHQNSLHFDVSKKYPLVGCRLKRGRPHWDKVFGYWVHLYPGQHLNLYCCGPKELVKLLRYKCKYLSRVTKTRFTFVHEAFS